MQFAVTRPAWSSVVLLVQKSCQQEAPTRRPGDISVLRMCQGCQIALMPGLAALMPGSLPALPSCMGKRRHKKLTFDGPSGHAFERFCISRGNHLAARVP